MTRGEGLPELPGRTLPGSPHLSYRIVLRRWGAPTKDGLLEYNFVPKSLVPAWFRLVPDPPEIFPNRRHLIGKACQGCLVPGWFRLAPDGV